MQLERELKRFVRQIRPGLIGATSNPNVNLAQLIEDLKTIPDARRELSHGLKELLTTRDFIQALTETGLTLESGVFSEVYKRIEYKFLPRAYDHNDILNLLNRVFDSRSSDAGWLEKIDHELFAEFLGLILPPREELTEAMAPQLLLSLEILSLRLAGLGYDPLVTHRLKGRREFQYSFMEVTRHVHGLIDGKGGMEESIRPVRDSLKQCAMAVNWIRSRRSIEGASLGLTYRLTKIQQIVHRMEQLLDVLEAAFGQGSAKPALDLFIEITLAEIERFNLMQFLGHNLQMLTFQITEHTGKAGEHYITKTRDEWVDMFRSAAIGGVIVAALAVLKVLISKLGLPPIPEALAFGTLYASGFVFILYVGGTLATKQPAMTASTLAQALDEATNSKQALENLSEVLIRTSRSQFAALLGNYMVAFPAAVFFCLPFYFSHHDLMSMEKAHHTLEAYHPFKSLSFWYAAVAGLGLFLSGLLAGFADNWFVFNNVGFRLRQSELLKKLVGPHNLDRAINAIDHNLGFWVGNISLGYYLGLAGAVGVIMGLPINTAHITFSTATFGAAMVSLKFQYPLYLIGITAVSIFCFGLINLSVSFSLSLIVAVKSRRVKFSQTPDLLRLMARKFRTRPSEFFVPPRDAE